MNKKGAYRDFRKKISAVIDSLLGMKTEAYESVSKMILTSILRSIVLIVLCIALAFVSARMSNVNYYNDSRYDKERLEDITWENENIVKLNEAYEKHDFETIHKLYYQNTSIVSNWEHYASSELLYQYDKLMKKETLSDYEMTDVMYFLYFPEYYVYRAEMSAAEKEEYEENRQNLIEKAEKDGYGTEKLEELYHRYADSYGYLSYENVQKILEEVKNG